MDGAGGDNVFVVDADGETCTFNLGLSDVAHRNRSGVLLEIEMTAPGARTDEQCLGEIFLRFIFYPYSGVKVIESESSLCVSLNCL